MTSCCVICAGVPGVKPERMAEGMQAKHCALSLVGEPIMYPEINALAGLLHDRGISTFLVTNAQFPDAIRCVLDIQCIYMYTPCRLLSQFALFVNSSTCMVYMFVSRFVYITTYYSLCLCRNLVPVTQLYVSVDASTKESLKKIDRPLFRDFWPRFISSLEALSEKVSIHYYLSTLL